MVVPVASTQGFACGLHCSHWIHDENRNKTLDVAYKRGLVYVLERSDEDIAEQVNTYHVPE